MSEHDVQTLPDALQGIQIAMVVTSSPDGEFRSRPLAIATHDARRLKFLVERDADWVRELARDNRINLSLTDKDHGRYVSLSGKGQVSSAKQDIEDAWNTGAKAYFDGPDDPRIALLTVEVSHGEFWSGSTTSTGRTLTLLGRIAGLDISMGRKGDVAV